MKRSVTALACDVVPVQCWRSFFKAPPLVPLYHLVNNESVPHVRHLYGVRSVREFEQDLDYILKRFQPVGLDTLINFAERPSRRQRKYFHLTFDDGFREQHEIVAPILLRKGIPASFFLATSFLDNRSMAHRNKVSLLIERVRDGISSAAHDKAVELLGPNRSESDVVQKFLAIPWKETALVDEAAKILGVDIKEYLKNRRPYLNSEQVRSLRDQGFSIGAHSCDHPLYREISLEEQLTQTRQSVDSVKSITNEPVRGFAFPFTSDGVSAEFFRSLFTETEIKATFGINGLVRSLHPQNLPRVIMEQGDRTAKDIITSEYLRAFRMRFKPGEHGL